MANSAFYFLNRDDMRLFIVGIEVQVHSHGYGCLFVRRRMGFCRPYGASSEAPFEWPVMPLMILVCKPITQSKQ